MANGIKMILAVNIIIFVFFIFSQEVALSEDKGSNVEKDLPTQTIGDYLKVKSINGHVYRLNAITDDVVNIIKGWHHVAVLFTEDNLYTFIGLANELNLFLEEQISWIFVTANKSVKRLSEIRCPRSQITIVVPQINSEIDDLSEWFTFNFSRISPIKTTNSINHLPIQCNGTITKEKIIKVKVTNKLQENKSIPSQMLLYDMFYSNQSNQTEILPFAAWKSVSGLKFYTNMQDIDPERHLRGRPLKVITFEEQPYLFINNSNNIYGYLYDLLTIVTQHLNINPKFEIAPTAATGIEISPGNYSGVVGILYRRESDLAMAAMGYTISRRPAIRFSAPVITEMYLTIFLRTPPLGISYTDYFDVFSRGLWISVIGCLGLALTALVTVASFRPIVITAYDNLSTTSMRTVVSGVKRRLYWIFSGMFYEEVMTYPYGRAAKIVVGVFLVAIFVTYSYYTTALTSFVITQVIKLPFSNMEELVYENPNYRIVLVSGNNHYDHFRNADEGLYKKVWESVNTKRKLKDVVSDVQQGLDKVYKEDCVLFGDGPSAKFIIRENSSLTFLETNYFNEYSHFPIRMDYPYYNIISTTLQKLNENGVLDLLSKRYFPFLKKIKSRSIESSTLSINQVIIPFLALGIGLISSIVVLLLEILVNLKL
ncbi:hypothetical protein CHUAL_004521 [Chamberlinius hualienensis]